MGATAIGTIGLGSTVAGGILSAFGAEKQGQSQSKMYGYQAQVSKINANIDRQNRDWALHKGDVDNELYGLKAGQEMGKIRAVQGASGLDVNTGSNAKVQSSQQKVAGIDMAQIRENSAKTAYDYTVKATMDENQADLYTRAGKDAATAGHIAALGSIVGTAGSVSSKWLQGKQAGMWGGSSGSNPLYGPDQTVTGYA